MKMCCCRKNKNKKTKKDYTARNILFGNLAKIILIWCVVQSVQKTIEANAAARARAEKLSQEQEWEFDRVYPNR